MNLQDAIALIQHRYIAETPNANWVDLGCGSGLFTYALANILQKGSSIHAADKSPVPLQKLPNPQNINIYKKQMDFTKDALPFDRPDGILMANALHYVVNKAHFISRLGSQLTEQGVWLIVEYDTDKSTPWVPYPSSCYTLESLFTRAGYDSFTKIHETASAYNTGNIYAALIKKNG